MRASHRIMRRTLTGFGILVLLGAVVALALRSHGPAGPAQAQKRQSSSSQADMGWRADAERPARSEWASESCASSDRVRRVRGPRAQGRYAYRFEVRDGDDSYGERCELGQGNPRRAGFQVFTEGEERWISWQVYLPRDYPVYTSTWNVFMQLKQLGALGTPVVSMEVRNGRFYLMNSDTNRDSSDTNTKWTGRARRGRWVKFTLHVRFSPSAREGFLELFGDLDGRGERRLTSKIRTYTMKVDNGRAVPSHARIGIYRNPRISGTAHIYFDGYTVAGTKGTAERSAFTGHR